MIKLFGKEYTLNSLLYVFILVCSIVIIFLNSLYFILFKENIFNWNMGLGIILFISSVLNLFSKKKKNRRI
ncbi:hypothetical protein SAMN05878443_2348 [Carnobacterium alterfunditum]|uniref:Uncharacterized protein n=1 Tax=Carnobacterium alterfunditum TaxID=28230 RepID=A0A1N6IIC8_9LACT|nr:hypothetical protein [Carnobacterium alterfunditum]SIO31729.1 hypothetical protein SAMN05878443_2348 [Carnobacterium alterfunditum]